MPLNCSHKRKARRTLGWPGRRAAQEANKLSLEMRLGVRPTLLAVTTTTRTTHWRGAHVSGQPRSMDHACQPEVRRIGIRTRVFSHSTTSSLAFAVAGATDTVR